MKNVVITYKTEKHHDLLVSYFSTMFHQDQIKFHTLNLSVEKDAVSTLYKLNPDLIISLDLSGFELRTLTGECLLNMLPCKVCNIIWGDKPEYSNYLSGKLSLSMLFYDATGIDNQLPSKYPNMRYYCTTFTTLQDIWDHFTKEVLL